MSETPAMLEFKSSLSMNQVQATNFTDFMLHQLLIIYLKIEHKRLFKNLKLNLKILILFQNLQLNIVSKMQ